MCACVLPVVGWMFAEHSWRRLTGLHSGATLRDGVLYPYRAVVLWGRGGERGLEITRTD